MDRLVYDWLYHYWFRCEVEGIEHVPNTGGALLVSNHSGALPPDAAMITKAIKEEHARPRPLHLTVEHFFKGYPGLQHARLQDRRRARPPGQRPPAAARRGAARARLPRGPQGHREALQGPLPAAPLRPRRLRRGGDARAASRSSRSPSSAPRRRCPIFAHVNVLQRLTGLLYFPITPTFPHFGLAGFLGYLPAKFRIRFLEPIPTDQWGEEPWADRGLVQTVADEIRSLHPGGADRHARRAPLRVVRMTALRASSSPACRPTGAAGSPRRSSATSEVEAIVGVSAEDPTLELERTEFVRVGTQHALLRRIVQAAEIDTVIDTRLVVDSIQASPRDAHENNVIGTMNVLAACGGPDSPVRKVVFKSSAHYYGCERDDPAFFTEEMQRPHPPRTRLESDIVEAESAVRAFAERNRGRHGERCCASPTASGPDLRDLAHPAAAPARGPLHPRLRPALPVRPRGRHRRRARARGRPRPARRLQRGRRRRARAVGDRSTCSASRSRPCCRRGGRGWPPRASASPGSSSRPSCSSSCATAAGWTTASSRPPAAALRYTTREAVQRFAEELRVAGACAQGEDAPYRYEREVEEFLRYSPSVRRRAEREPTIGRLTCQTDCKASALQEFVSTLRRSPRCVPAPSPSSPSCSSRCSPARAASTRSTTASSETIAEGSASTASPSAGMSESRARERAARQAARAARSPGARPLRGPDASR